MRFSAGSRDPVIGVQALQGCIRLREEDSNL